MGITKNIEWNPNDFSYRIEYTDTPDHPFSVGLFGCMGTGPSDPILRASMSGLSEKNPQMCILLGDIVYNFWDDGAASAADLKRFLNVMNAYNGPVFIANGNHDRRIHGTYQKLGRVESAFTFTSAWSQSWFKRNISNGTEAHLKMRMFLLNDPEASPQFKGVPEHPQIIIDEHQENKFKGGKDIYSIKCFCTNEGGNQLTREYIIIDTNSLPYAGVHLGHTPSFHIRQLLSQILNSDADEIIICGHHPIMMPTLGKRRFKPDGQMYADANARMAADSIKRSSYHEKRDYDEARREAYDRVQAHYEQLKARSGPGHSDILRCVWEDMLALTHGRIISTLGLTQDRVVALFGDEDANTVLMGKLKRASYVCAHDHFSVMGVGKGAIPCVVAGAVSGEKSDKARYAREDPRAAVIEGRGQFVIHSRENNKSVFSAHVRTNGTVESIATMMTQLEYVMGAPAEGHLRKTTIQYPDRIRYVKNGRRKRRKSVSSVYNDGGDSCSDVEDWSSDDGELTPLITKVQIADDRPVGGNGYVDIDGLDRSLDALAHELPILRDIPETYLKEAKKDVRRMVRMLLVFRDMSCRLRRELFESGYGVDHVVRIANALQRVVDIYLTMTKRGGAILTYHLKKEEYVECQEHLKLMRKYDSRQLLVADTLFITLLLVMCAVVFRVRFMTGDLETFDRLTEHPTKDNLLETILPTLGGIWLLQAMYRGAVRPRLTSFGVCLRHFTNTLSDILTESKPLPAATESTRILGV